MQLFYFDVLNKFSIFGIQTHNPMVVDKKMLAISSVITLVGVALISKGAMVWKTEKAGTHSDYAWIIPGGIVTGLGLFGIAAACGMELQQS